MLPGKIQAEHFDADGQGKGYRDLDDVNEGNAGIRQRQGVDVYETQTGEVHVRRTRDGEWLEYTVTVAETGNYYVEVSVSSANNNPGDLVVNVDGQWFARFDVPATGSNRNWEQLQSRAKPIGAGVHVIRLRIVDGGNFGIDWFALRAK